MTQTIPTFDHPGDDLITAFVDGELPTAEDQATQQHIVTCHRCTLRVLAATQLKAATARAAQRFTAPTDALSRLAAQLTPKAPQELKKPARVYPFRSLAGIALAASLVVTVALAGWRQTHQANTLSAELLDQHLATLSSGAAPEVISTDRHTVKPWFQGKLPFSFNLPDTLPADMALKGGDFAYLDGKPAALLLFTIHKHQVSVFLTQRAGDGRPSTLHGSRSGFNLQEATTHDLRLTAVSDVNPNDLSQLVSALVQVQAP